MKKIVLLVLFITFSHAMFSQTSIKAHSSSKQANNIGEDLDSGLENFYVNTSHILPNKLTLKKSKNTNILAPIDSPADELIKFSKHYYTGLGMIGSGYFLVISSLLNGGLGSEGAVTGGGLLVLVGMILQLESHSHIGKAGKLMKIKESLSSSKKIKLNSSRSGLGLALNF